MTNPTWSVGQNVVINRQLVVKVERITPTGRVIAGGRTFEPDGHERGATRGLRWNQIEPLTTELRAELALIDRGKNARAEVFTSLGRAEKWLRGSSVAGWGRTEAPDLADVEKAEKLAAAINAVLGEQV